MDIKNPKYVGDKTPESYLKRVMQLPPVNSYQDELDSLMNRVAVNIKDKLDAICLQALQGGKYGVKVTTYLHDGSMLMEVSPDVPFGEIHYHNDDSASIPPVWQNSPISEYDA